MLNIRRSNMGASEKTAILVVSFGTSYEETRKKTIEQIEKLEGSVRLQIRFGDDLKKIDQKWLLRTNYK